MEKMKRFLPFLLMTLMCYTTSLLVAEKNSSIENKEGNLVQFPKEGEKDLKAFAFPNPLSINSIITYELAADSKVTMSLFDCQGRLIKELFDERQMAGNQKYFLERADLAAGLYFLNIKAADQVVSISIAVVD